MNMICISLNKFGNESCFIAHRPIDRPTHSRIMIFKLKWAHSSLRCWWWWHGDKTRNIHWHWHYEKNDPSLNEDERLQVFSGKLIGVLCFISTKYSNSNRETTSTSTFPFVVHSHTLFKQVYLTLVLNIQFPECLHLLHLFQKNFFS